MPINNIIQTETNTSILTVQGENQTELNIVFDKNRKELIFTARHDQQEGNIAPIKVTSKDSILQIVTWFKKIAVGAV